MNIVQQGYSYAVISASTNVSNGTRKGVNMVLGGTISVTILYVAVGGV